MIPELFLNSILSKYKKNLESAAAKYSLITNMDNTKK